MRYATSFKQPTKAEQALIRRRIRVLIKKFGNCRKAALRLGLTPKYLAALKIGDRINPGDAILRKLGLRRVTYIEEV